MDLQGINQFISKLEEECNHIRELTTKYEEDNKIYGEKIYKAKKIIEKMQNKAQAEKKSFYEAMATATVSKEANKNLQIEKEKLEKEIKELEHNNSIDQHHMQHEAEQFLVEITDFNQNNNLLSINKRANTMKLECEHLQAELNKEEIKLKNSNERLIAEIVELNQSKSNELDIELEKLENDLKQRKKILEDLNNQIKANSMSCN